jgi:hypothetical protein
VDAMDFARSMARLGYYRQGAFYVDGMRVLTGALYEFALVVAEREAPFGVRAAPLHPDAIAAGRLEYRELLLRIAEAQKTGRWSGYEDPDFWTLPDWAMGGEPVELSIGGRALAI